MLFRLMPPPASPFPPAPKDITLCPKPSRFHLHPPSNSRIVVQTKQRLATHERHRRSQQPPRSHWPATLELVFPTSKIAKTSPSHLSSEKGNTEKMATNSIKLLSGNSHPQLAKQMADRCASCAVDA